MVNRLFRCFCSLLFKLSFIQAPEDSMHGGAGLPDEGLSDEGAGGVVDEAEIAVGKEAEVGGVISTAGKISAAKMVEMEERERRRGSLAGKYLLLKW